MVANPIVVAADLVADRFITGTPKRISREAPVLILRHEGEKLVPGGGANAIANISALGGRPLPLGVVGEDESGRGLISAFEQAGIETAGILRRPGYRTPTKTRILGGGRHAIKQQIVRYDIEDSVELTPADEEHFTNVLAHHARHARVALISDYGYGSAVPSLVPILRGVLPNSAVLADSRYRLHLFKGLDGATPNEEEAEALLGRPLGETPEEVAHSSHELRRTLGCRFLLITRGSRGMSLSLDTGASAHLPVHGTDQVADVTGAGDTVIGTFGLALAAGATPLEAALLANYAGGVVVMKMGTATLSPDELRDAVASDAHPREALRWVES